MISLSLSAVGLPRCRYECHFNLSPGYWYISPSYAYFNMHIIYISCNRFWHTKNAMFIFFHNNSLDFNVYSLQNTYRLCLSIVPISAIHMQLWVRWQPYCRCFQISCARTPRQCLKFRLWTSCISLFWHLGFWNGVRVFGKFLNSSHKVYVYFVHPKSLWKQHEVCNVVCVD